MAPSTFGRVAALALAAVVVAFVATPAAACRCGNSLGLDAAAKVAAHVVRVSVTKALFIPHPLKEQGKQAMWAGRVLGSFKGCTPRSIQLVSRANSALCGVSLTVGEEYLFMLRAANADGNYSVAACDTFRTWAEVELADRLALQRINNLVCPPAPAPYLRKEASYAEA